MKRNQNLLYYTVVFVAWLVYLYFTYNTPQTTNTFGLTNLQIHLLYLTVTIPYLLIWWTALYSILHVASYAESIRDSLDGKAFSKITDGLFILLVSLISTAFLNIIRTNNHKDLYIVASSTIITNYIYVASSLTAFYFIYKGTQDLLKNIKAQAVRRNRIIISLIPVCIFSFLYIYLIITNPNKQIAATTEETASFYLPDILIYLTIVIPTILAWVWATMALVSLDHYKELVKGIVYKGFFNYFILGLIFVMSGFIIVQSLLSIGSGRLLNLRLDWILVIVYFFLLLQVLGYIFIALGAKKLSSIENV